MTQNTQYNNDLLKRLFKRMLYIRSVEETIAERYHELEMRCPVHLSIGQEAIATGVCEALGNNSYVLSGHRCHAHYLAKGGSLKAMIAELYGKVSGCSRGNGGSMHLVDLQAGFLGAAPIVGSTIPIAVGAAFGSVMQNKDNIAAVFFGDGATEEGVFHESLNFAALKKLPIIFVCENNFYSVYSPLSVRQPPGRPITQLVQGHGIESYAGNGNDVIEVYDLTSLAVNKVRQGSGPIFLEFKTYRWLEHCGPNNDNTLGYRSESEFEKWRQLCPVNMLQNKLLAEGVMRFEEIDAVKKEITVEIHEAFQFAKTSLFPEQKNLLEGVFAL